jgi:hypothetical protein
MSRAYPRSAVALLTALAIAATVAAAAAQPARPAPGPARSAPTRPLLPYPGAPPLVPHDVEDRKAICQECHATGEQGAPITPHPTRTHFCIQCHVGQDPAAKPFPPATPRR